MDKLKKMLTKELAKLRAELQKGTKDGSFVTLTGMTQETILMAKEATIVDVLKWIESIGD